MIKPVLISIIFLYPFFTNVFAQTFHPDKNGYVSDPRFHKLINDRGYELVSTFYKASKANNNISFAWVQLSGKPGKIDRNGKLIFMQGWEKDITDTSSEINLDIEPSNRIFSKVSIDSLYAHQEPVYRELHENGKYGTRNERGDAGIPAIFDAIRFINNDTVLVVKNKKAGIFKANGMEIIPPGYDFIVPVNDNNKTRTDIFIVVEGKKRGIINIKNEIILPIIFDEIIQPGPCENAFVVSRDWKWGLINLAGKEITKPVYSNIDDYDNFGTAIFRIRDSADHVWYGIMDCAGNEIVKPVYDEITKFNDDLVIITVGKVNESKDGLMERRTGNVILKPLYSHILKPVGDIALVVNTGNIYKKGLIDITGKELIKPVYDEVSYFNTEGLAKVGIDGKFGVIDKSQKFIVKPEYDRLQISKYKKLVLVLQKDQSGAFDFKGNLVIPFGPWYFDDDLNSNVIIYMDLKTGKKGALDKKGKILIKAAYDGLEENNEDGFIVKSGNKYGVIDSDGKLIVPILYDRIGTDPNGPKSIFWAKRDGKKCYIDLYGHEDFY